MLKWLQIKNIATIEELEAECKHGLNVLTGETGAGKSIIFEALNLILGGRASPDLIRSGSDICSAQALFDVSGRADALALLEEQGINCEDGLIVIRRDISASGKGKGYLNGNFATASMLKELGQLLVDLHGQGQHQILLNQAHHLDVVDSFGACWEARGKVESGFKMLASLRKELGELTMGERQRAQRADLLRFQVAEIEGANLQRGEEEELLRERSILQNAERIARECDNALGSLYYSEGATLEQLGKTLRSLESIASIDLRASPIAEDVRSIIVRLRDAADWLRSYGSKIEFDPHRLEVVEERLSRLKGLKKKYGDTSEEVLDYLERAKAELESIAGGEERIDELQQAAEAAERELYSLACALSAKRRRAAELLKKETARHLNELAMDEVRFSVVFEAEGPDEGGGSSRPEVGRNGIDKVEFYISANPGEALKPLAMTASGGELSRTMLALRSAISAADKTPCLVFDEIDSGIGGKVAEMVGRKLKEIASGRQVFCVTHLAQIASFADAHFLVEKAVCVGRSRTTIRELSATERIEEIARMSAGRQITEAAREHARQLLRKGKKE